MHPLDLLLASTNRQQEVGQVVRLKLGSSFFTCMLYDIKHPQNDILKYQTQRKTGTPISHLPTHILLHTTLEHFLNFLEIFIEKNIELCHMLFLYLLKQLPSLSLVSNE